MSFFIRSGKNGPKQAASRKRSAPDGKARGKPPAKSAKSRMDEEIASDSDSDLDVEKKVAEVSDSEDENETAQEKRLRLAKQYLQQLRDEEERKQDDLEDESLSQTLTRRLQDDVLRQAGKLHTNLAQQLSAPEERDIAFYRGHKLPLTCLVITPDDKHVFTASKDCSIIKWEVKSGKIVQRIQSNRIGDKKTGHKAQVLCLAISSDGKYLTSGDCNHLIHVWNPEDCSLTHTFRGHKGPVLGLSFRVGSHDLYSGSKDKSVKIWNLDEMAYVETLFGHQDGVSSVDSLSRERAITAGGRDSSIRVWKIVEESQLVFLGSGAAIDCVSLINESHFVSGSDDNSISLWGVLKKKPLHTVKQAHQADASATGVSNENWISALATLPNTDLVASGSRDGSICVWRVTDDFRKLERLFTVPVVGFVNGLAFSSDGATLIAAVGQEHKSGRWWRIKQAKNGIVVIKLKNRT